MLRVLDHHVMVISFFEYHDVIDILALKYESFGSRAIKLMSKRAFKAFRDYVNCGEIAIKFNNAYGIPFDDKPKHGYSHTALIAREFRSIFKPLYNSLRSCNNVRYAARDLHFRLTNPRDLRYKGPAGVDVVVFDDIVTSGTSLMEAKKTIDLEANMLFGITLTDSKRHR